MPNYADESSEQLLALIAQGDRDAFSCFMTRHKDLVFSFAYRMLGNYEEAEDVAQEVFLKIWGSASKYRGNAKASTWILAFTANLCKNRLRSFWRSRAKVGMEALEGHSSAEAHRPDTQALHNERQLRINAAINALPVNQRIAITFWRHENMSYREISEAMKCSVSNVEILLHRAKRFLISQLGDKT